MLLLPLCTYETHLTINPTIATPPPSPITPPPPATVKDLISLRKGSGEAWEGPGFHFFRGHSTDFWLQSECDTSSVTGAGRVGECAAAGSFLPPNSAARTQNTAATRGVSQAVDAMSKLCSIQSSRKSARHTSMTGHRRVNYCLRQPRILLIFYIPAKDHLSQ
jgi:hypothetical protein